MSDKLIAEKCDKCGLLKAGDLHQFPVCAVDALKTLGDKNRALEAEIERLRNPWVSGKARPPKKGQRVIVKYTYPNGEFSTFDGEIGYTDRLVGEEESHPIAECDWMPIPEIKE